MYKKIYNSVYNGDFEKGCKAVSEYYYKNVRKDANEKIKKAIEECVTDIKQKLPKLSARMVEKHFVDHISDDIIRTYVLKNDVYNATKFIYKKGIIKQHKSDNNRKEVHIQNSGLFIKYVQTYSKLCNDMRNASNRGIPIKKVN